MIKPEVKLSGENGNIFNLASIVRRALIDHHGYTKGRILADKMLQQIMKADSYESALSIITEYVDVY